MTDTLKLKAKIAGSGMTQPQIAKAIGINPASLNYKVNNKVEFKATEIKKLCVLLSIVSAEELVAIFFAEDVD